MLQYIFLILLKVYPQKLSLMSYPCKNIFPNTIHNMFILFCELKFAQLNLKVTFVVEMLLRICTDKSYESIWKVSVIKVISDTITILEKQDVKFQISICVHCIPLLSIKISVRFFFKYYTNFRRPLIVSNHMINALYLFIYIPHTIFFIWTF